VSGRRAWALVLALAGCASKPPAPATCPPCQCNCNPAGTAGTPGTPGTPGAPSDAATNERVADLVESATRKMNFKDGAGCLADLDQVAALSPRMGRQTTYMRAQCEMVAGKCVQGKQRWSAYMREQQNMHPDRVAQAAESIAAMYCRGGDTPDRERLLGALQTLAMASTETHPAAECRALVKTVRELAPRVKPQGVDDHQVANIDKTLYATAPGCLARAGDCAGAWQLFRELYPPESLPKDEKVREDVFASVFDSLVPRCKGKR
jgi:hypothetical protein